MSQADICLLPSNSHSETFGMVLVEAMTLAKPCVGTNVGGIPEVIADEQTGLVVPGGEPDALARALGRLAGSSELRHRMGLAGQARAARDFTLARQAARIEDELHRAILG
jgi:glycosyltransferase involved in cell wall biosynthesis